MERIDTHAHIVPEVWRQWCLKYGLQRPDGMSGIPAWSPESHIASMEENRVTRSILSVTSPGTAFGDTDEICRQITRETNDAIAGVCGQYPDKFGFFASLPLPDVDGSLEEIDYALDTLKADGFALMTNARGHYLGDEKLDAVFAKLNERKAKVFMHPTACCHPENPKGPWPLNKYMAPMMEYFFDTSRVVTNLLLSGTVTKYPNITYLVSHCGATLAPLVQRIAAFSGGALPADKIKELFRTRFYFDLAGFPFPDLIHGFLNMAGPDRLLYGSDGPYTPPPMVAKLANVMDEELPKLFDEDTIRQIYSGNAKQILNL
ncbi:hypothetical protein ASPWEDRAFT_68099 [Aspergillus wentii DTO 134E9]|uniref:6-methylsalicylate decarboxylase n=1 Tax=Aspergillus wentii DTO 134E9 TaxID=1073089 RepID=A0A1L9RSR9_ASPWE|nr:uncharacterized protein ASPWEDRAFT_68099 [Aspergillus wentii DTO 134E9]OJJ38001.1 hypothetical protein ASPWEDRAFT_68099 [Aspergillus wentii DTO 134E9]